MILSVLPFPEVKSTELSLHQRLLLLLQDVVPMILVVLKGRRKTWRPRVFSIPHTETDEAGDVGSKQRMPQMWRASVGFTTQSEPSSDVTCIIS